VVIYILDLKESRVKCIYFQICGLHIQDVQHMMCDTDIKRWNSCSAQFEYPEYWRIEFSK